ncbi:MAG TPA: cyclic nucleotide-binding domain-containing protein [Pseudobdellovibrionaceae bacterium]|jgi:CRP-like cAMP-binding protein|nr:cyclic nucleotide-binding domain-containing protein [Pseudobdellovibrionaceae bacterium]
MNDSEKVMEILKNVPLFTGVKDNQHALEEIIKLMKRRSGKMGESVIIEGESGNEFFILLSGRVSVYKNTPDGNIYKVVVLTSNMNPGIGEGGLVDAEARSATVKCDVDCEFLVLERTDFDGFCDRHPKYAVPIYRKIAMVLMNRIKQSNQDMALLHKALMNEIRGTL